MAPITRPETEDLAFRCRGGTFQEGFGLGHGDQVQPRATAFPGYGLPRRAPPCRASPPTPNQLRAPLDRDAPRRPSIPPPGRNAPVDSEPSLPKTSITPHAWVRAAGRLEDL